jgi:hypothetical protein
MPYEDAEQNMRCFAKDVMPALQKLDPKTVAVGRAPAAEKSGAVGLLGS